MMKPNIIAIFLMLLMSKAHVVSQSELLIPPSLHAKDVMVLLEASWIKVHVEGVPKDQFDLKLIPEGNRKPMHLFTFPFFLTKESEICFLAKDSEGLCGKGKEARIAFNMETGPLVHRGHVKFNKCWASNKGSAFSGVYTIQTFNDVSIQWDSVNMPVLELAKVLWTPKKMTGQEALDGDSSVKLVAKLVLERRTK